MCTWYTLYHRTFVFNNSVKYKNGGDSRGEHKGMQLFLLLQFAGFLSKRIKLDQSTDRPSIYPFILEQGISL